MNSIKKIYKVRQLPREAQTILEVQLEDKQPEDMILTYH